MAEPMKPVEAWAVVGLTSNALLSADSIHGTRQSAEWEIGLYSGLGEYRLARVRITEVEEEKP